MNVDSLSPTLVHRWGPIMANAVVPCVKSTPKTPQKQGKSERWNSGCDSGYSITVTCVGEISLKLQGDFACTCRSGRAEHPYFVRRFAGWLSRTGQLFSRSE